MSWSCEGQGHNEENETLTQMVNIISEVLCG